MSIPNKSIKPASAVGCVVVMDTGTSLDMMSSNEGSSTCCHSYNKIRDQMVYTCDVTAGKLVAGIVGGASCCC